MSEKAVCVCVLDVDQEFTLLRITLLVVEPQ